MSIQRELDKYIANLYGPKWSPWDSIPATSWLEAYRRRHNDFIPALGLKKEPSMTTLRPVPAVLAGPLDEVLELHRLRPVLLEILRFALARWPSSLAEVTSALRTAAEDAAVGGSGLHVLGRAVDLRTKDLPGGHAAVFPLAHEINERWAYDPARPYKNVAVVTPHGTGPHLHIQVHQETKEREA